MMANGQEPSKGTVAVREVPLEIFELNRDI